MSAANLPAPQPDAPGEMVPECITRDNLTGPYFPNTSRAMLQAVIALGVIFALTSFNRLNHTDLWGHLDFGRWIVEHRALPTTDPLGANPATTPVLNSAWLAQVIGYEGYSWSGHEGLVLGHALLVTLTAGVLMLAVVRRGMPASWAWVAGLAMFLLDTPIVGTIRPQLFGQLGVALFLLACSDLDKKWQPLVWLPIVAALWANLHGSILMGLAIFACYAMGMTWTLYREAQGDFPALLRDRRLGRVWLALLLSLGGACLNPHGPELLIKAIFFGEHAALSYISEWRRMTPSSLTGMLLIISAVGALALMKYEGKLWPVHELLLLALFGAATCSAIRMLAWWALVWTWVVIPHAASAWRKYRDEHGYAPEAADEPDSMRTLLAMGVVFATAIIAPPTYGLITGRERGEVPAMVRETPVHLADEAVRRGLAGNFAAPMDWADFLVWKTGEQLRPMIYGHIHLASMSTFEDYSKIYAGHELWLQVLHSQKVRYLFVSQDRNKELANLVLQESRANAGRVRLLYVDQRGLIAEIAPAPADTASDSIK